MVLMPQNPCGLECTKIPLLFRGLSFDEVTQTNQPATQLLLHAYPHVRFLNAKESNSLRGTGSLNFQLSEIKLSKKDYYLLPVISVTTWSLKHLKNTNILKIPNVALNQVNILKEKGQIFKEQEKLTHENVCKNYIQNLFIFIGCLIDHLNFNNFI